MTHPATTKKHHPDLYKTVMHNGVICRIIGVTYSHPEYRGNKPFYSYHLMPDGKFSLKDSIQYQTVDKLAFEPLKHIPVTNSDKFITIDDAPYLELVKG
jgi:hypothetical protein